MDYEDIVDPFNGSYGEMETSLCTQKPPDVVWDDNNTIDIKRNQQKRSHKASGFSHFQMLISKEQAELQEAKTRPGNGFKSTDDHVMEQLETLFKDETEDRNKTMETSTLNEDDSFMLISQNFQTPKIYKESKQSKCQQATSTPCQHDMSVKSPILSPINEGTPKSAMKTDTMKENKDLTVLGAAPKVRRNLMRVQSFEHQPGCSTSKIIFNKTRSFEDERGQNSEPLLSSQTVTRKFASKAIGDGASNNNSRPAVVVKLVDKSKETGHNDPSTNVTSSSSLSSSVKVTTKQFSNLNKPQSKMNSTSPTTNKFSAKTNNSNEVIKSVNNIISTSTSSTLGLTTLNTRKFMSKGNNLMSSTSKTVSFVKKQTNSTRRFNNQPISLTTNFSKISTKAVTNNYEPLKTTETLQKEPPAQAIRTFNNPANQPITKEPSNVNPASSTSTFVSKPVLTTCNIIKSSDSTIPKKQSDSIGATTKTKTFCQTRTFNKAVLVTQANQKRPGQAELNDSDNIPPKRVVYSKDEIERKRLQALQRKQSQNIK